MGVDGFRGFPPLFSTIQGADPLTSRKRLLLKGALIGLVLVATLQGSSVRVPITLAWNDNSSNEDGFRIERSSDNIEFVEIAVVGENVTQYTDSESLVAGQLYAYRVRAFNEYGNSGYTNTRTTYYSPEPEFYFGELGSNGGAFAIMCRGDGSAIFIGTTDSESSAALVEEFQFGPEGGFSFDIPELGVFSGQIVEGQVFGSVESSNMNSGGLSIASSDLFFSGAVSRMNGDTSSLAGFYDTGANSESGARLWVLAGPDGVGFVVSSIGSEVSAGELDISSDASGLAVLGDGSEISFGFDQMTRFVSGTVSKRGQSIEFLGLEEKAKSKGEFFNASMRSRIKRGATIVAGFVISGTGVKRLLLRGIGPALETLGLDAPVLDPSMKLFRFGEPNALFQNDDWGSENEELIQEISESVGAFALDPTSKDAALLVEAPPGLYWLHFKNESDADGTGLIEIYDVDRISGARSTSSLVNLSLRGTASQDTSPIIAGFVVGGDTAKGVMIRAMGRELEPLGVSHPLRNPVLKVYGSGSHSGLLAENSNWQNDSDLLTEIADDVGAFAFEQESLSAAKAMWLNAGLYTVVVNGHSSGSGEVLVELYEIP